MSQQRHIIGRTVLEIDSDRLDEVWSFQHEISDLLQQRVIPEMEQLFDQWVEADEVIRLDQLVVEVDPVDRHFLADEFVHNVLEALGRTLSERLADRVSVAAEAAPISRDRARADWEVLLYFLQYGRLPWWSLAEDWQSWIPRWEAVMQAGIHWQAPLRALLTSHPVARQRLVAQFPEGFRHQVVLQLQPTWSGWSTLLAQARSLIQALGLRGSIVQQLQTQAWIILLAKLGQESSPGRSLATTQWMRDWLAYLIQTWQPESRTEPGQALPTDGSDAQSLTQSRPGFTTNNSAELNSQTDTRPEEQAGSRAIAYQRLHTQIESIPVAERSLWLAALDQVIPRLPTAQSPTSTRRQSAPNSQDDMGEPVGSSSQTTDIDSTAQSPAISSEAISEDLENTVEQTVGTPEVSDLDTYSGNIPERADNSPLSPEEEAAGLFVNQAGLVILHPFLRLYFEDVGLLDGEAFRDEAAQQTAIYLLHYLATGQTDAPEYELVLPKLLCGWPLSEPVARGLVLPDAALAEGENLLQAVINYWQVLKSTSPDGLREGFLQREGKLTRLYEGDWRLQVEQQATDVLLGSLPWGFNVVKLPWMENLLMVEWI
jgi:Contractile injection system tape measure protein